jgi:hypothetical protein
MIATATFPIHQRGSPATASGHIADRETRYAVGRGGVIDVSRPARPWRWRTVMTDALSLVAVAWSVPLVVLVVGTPIALAIVLLLWVGRQVLGAL